MINISHTQKKKKTPKIHKGEMANNIENKQKKINLLQMNKITTLKKGVKENNIGNF